MFAYFEYPRDRQQEMTVERQQGMNTSPHLHQLVEVMLVERGAVNFTVNSKSSLLETGAVSIADSFDIHAVVAAGEDVQALFFFLPPALLGDFYAFKQNRDFGSNVLFQSRHFAELLAVERRFSALERPNLLFQQGLANEILGLLADEIPLAAHRQSGDIQFARELLIYIEEHCAEPLDLDEVAAHFHYSRSYVSRLFHQYVPCHFSTYLNQLRVERVLAAARRDPQASVAKLIYEHGYANPQTFYRAFKELYGTTPVAYLKQLKLR